MLTKRQFSFTFSKCKLSIKRGGFCKKKNVMFFKAVIFEKLAGKKAAGNFKIQFLSFFSNPH